MDFRAAFPALSHKQYRWFWGTQVISMTGTWTQMVGQAWLVLQLTNSPFLLGLISALQFTPVLLFSLQAGVWIDRLPKRRILLFTQTSLMVLAFSMAILVGTGLITYGMLAVFALLLGMVNTIDMPARQAYFVELVGKEHLTNAIALNSASFNGARIIGPALAGMIMGLWGPTWCFIINGLSFIGVILVLAFFPQMPQGERLVSGPPRAVWSEVREGLQYIWQTPLILLGMIMIAFLSAIAMNFNVLVPVLAKIELEQGALGYGLLMSSLGFGAVVGALTVAVFSRNGPRMSLVFGGAAGLGIFSILVGLQSTYAGAAVMLAFMGWSMIAFSASTNSLIQTTVDNRLRGRVMSVYSLVFGGMTPIGSFYAGALAGLWGAKKTFLFSGLLVLVFLGILLWKRQRFATSD